MDWVNLRAQEKDEASVTLFSFGEINCTHITHPCDSLYIDYINSLVWQRNEVLWLRKTMACRTSKRKWNFLVAQNSLQRCSVRNARSWESIDIFFSLPVRIFGQKGVIYFFKAEIPLNCGSGPLFVSAELIFSEPALACVFLL